jgi:hypothetical protein
MPINQKDWPEQFLKIAPPTFPCPRCAKTTFTPKKPITSFEPKHSKNDRGHEAWEPFWIQTRVSIQYTCISDDCGEIGFLIGEGYVDEVYGEDYDVSYEEFVRIKSIFPAPDVFALPDGAPAEVVEPVKLSFIQFWVDLSACATHLRISVEALLDYFSVPRVLKKTGKDVIFSLHHRIDLLRKSGNALADDLEAIKWIGNIGAHDGQNKLEREQIFDAFEIYEEVLAEEFSRKAHRAKLKAKAKQINQKKGKK